MDELISEFARHVYLITKMIPFGRVATYTDIANKMGKPKAVRAVGNALHNNPQMIIIPCHRVVNIQGKLAKNFGFHGADGQKELLEKEGVVVINNQVDLCQHRVKELK